jgi:hypothetical protein
MIDYTKSPGVAVQKPSHSKVDKPKKVTHTRNKPRLRDRGRIRPEVYEAAYNASGGRCEWCKFKDGAIDPKGQKWGLEAAHGVRRRHLDETTADDLIMLCGPSVNSGTCHNEADYTRAGRERMIEHMKLRKRDVG